MKDDSVLRHLSASGVPFAVIGAHALAAHGLARFTVDVDVLVMSSSVLEMDFWPEDLRTRILDVRRGDDSDPLRGVVRFGAPLALDIVVGRGPLMRSALAAAKVEPAIELPVVAPSDLIALKLEAGGPQDLADIASLLEVRKHLLGHDHLRDEVLARLPSFSAWAQAAWRRLEVIAPRTPSRR